MIHFCPNCGYKLSEIEPEAPQNASGEVTGSILEDYQAVITPDGVEIAQPEVLDNKKRLQQLARRPIPIVVPKRMDTELDDFNYKGEKMFFGEGLEQTL